MNDKQKETKCIVQPELIKHKTSSPEHAEAWEVVRCLSADPGVEAQGCSGMMGLGLGPAQSEQGRGIRPRSSLKLTSVLHDVSPCAEPGWTRARSALQRRLGWCTNGQLLDVCFPRAFSLRQDKAWTSVQARLLFLPASLREVRLSVEWLGCAFGYWNKACFRFAARFA